MRNHSELALKRARVLRADLTPPEAMIWRWLRGRRFGDWKFRRQHPIGNYIVDFYCHELRLAIEIDGSQHEFQQLYDVNRDGDLSKLGVAVLRIESSDVRRDPQTVADQIEGAIESCRPLTPRAGGARNAR